MLAAIVFGVAGVVAIATSIVVARRHDRVRSSAALSALLVAVGAWVGTYAASLVLADHSVVLVVEDATSACSLVLATALLHFVGRSLHADRWLTRASTVSLGLIDVGLSTLLFLDPSGLFTQPLSGADARTAVAGAGYWALMAWVGLHLLVITWLIVRDARSSGEDTRVPRSMAALASITWLMGFLRVAGVEILGLDPVAVGVLIGAVSCVVAAFAERSVALESLGHAEFLRHLEDGVVVLDSEDRIAAINANASSRLGVAGTESLRRPFLEVVGDARSWRDCIAGTASTVEVRTADGGTRHLRTDRMPLHDARGRAIGSAFLIHDRTEAHVDALTGVGNRRCFADSSTDIVDSALNADRPVCIAAIDIDNLKSLNDRSGHFAGDAAISAAASVMRTTLRIGDRVVRLGGDEFVALLVDADPEQARVIAERLRQGVERLANGTTLSIGIARVGHAGRLPRALARADHALYEAKRAGRNRVVLADA